jgi:hypothetical protein
VFIASLDFTRRADFSSSFRLFHTDAAGSLKLYILTIIKLSKYAGRGRLVDIEVLAGIGLLGSHG